MAAEVAELVVWIAVAVVVVVAAGVYALLGQAIL
jgi:hypothetical protein